MADEIKGWQIDLSEGRHVFVSNQDNAFLIRFQNAEGAKTYIKISKDAADALSYLLGSHIPQADIVKKFMLQWTTAAERMEPEFHWQEVKPDALPCPEQTPEEAPK